MGDWADDEDSKLGDEVNIQQAREEQWASGEHTTSAGKTLKLTDMATSHLQNTINKFAGIGYDTSALEEELKGRTQN